MSPGRDTLIDRALANRNIPALYAALPLLQSLSADVLTEVMREIEWFTLPAAVACTAAVSLRMASTLSLMVRSESTLHAPTGARSALE
jgi:hypothetical protein